MIYLDKVAIPIQMAFNYKNQSKSITEIELKIVQQEI